MKDIYIFKRVEKKYRVTTEEKRAFLNTVAQYLEPDAHGRSTVSSLYIDTPDYLLIRNSIDAKVYKEKLRLRCYNTPSKDTTVFLEIKKKFKGVVYKRRIPVTLENAYEYLYKGIKPEASQIMNEIDYAMKIYRSPKPTMLISYEREAYFGKNLPTLRITFDSNVRYREENLDLSRGSEGNPIIPHGEYIMEIKTDGAVPIWLARALDECKIYPVPFSKYGVAYRIKTGELASPEITKETGENEYACIV